MPTSTVTIAISFVHNMLQGVHRRGLPVTDFLADAGIAPALLSQPSARVTVEQYVDLFKSVVTRLDDDLLGLQSRPVRQGSFALIARSALSAPTLEVAIRRLARTYRLLQDDVVIDMLQDGNLVGLSLRFEHPDDERWTPFLHELLIRVFWRLLAWLVGGKLPVTRFDFAFRKPDYADNYNRVFPAPLAFGCERSAFWFEARRLSQRIRQDESSLHQFLANAQNNIILPQRRSGTDSASVRRHLQQSLPNWPDLHATAQALHVSAATLQRRLAAEHTTFTTLRDSLRRDMAIVRLSNSQTPLPELASELGFSDSASFQRAFKAWTGSAPGAYRRQCHHAGAVSPT